MELQAWHGISPCVTLPQGSLSGWTPVCSLSAQQAVCGTACRVSIQRSQTGALQWGGLYRFRITAHNSVGSSRPGPASRVIGLPLHPREWPVHRVLATGRQHTKTRSTTADDATSVGPGALRRLLRRVLPGSCSPLTLPGKESKGSATTTNTNTNGHVAIVAPPTSTVASSAITEAAIADDLDDDIIAHRATLPGVSHVTLLHGPPTTASAVHGTSMSSTAQALARHPAVTTACANGIFWLPCRSQVVGAGPVDPVALLAAAVAAQLRQRAANDALLPAAARYGPCAAVAAASTAAATATTTSDDSSVDAGSTSSVSDGEDDALPLPLRRKAVAAGAPEEDEVTMAARSLLRRLLQQRRAADRQSHILIIAEGVHDEALAQRLVAATAPEHTSTAWGVRLLLLSQQQHVLSTLPLSRMVSLALPLPTAGIQGIIHHRATSAWRVLTSRAAPGGEVRGDPGAPAGALHALALACFGQPQVAVALAGAVAVAGCTMTERSDTDAGDAEVPAGSWAAAEAAINAMGFPRTPTEALSRALALAEMSLTSTALAMAGGPAVAQCWRDLAGVLPAGRRISSLELWAVWQHHAGVASLCDAQRIAACLWATGLLEVDGACSGCFWVTHEVEARLLAVHGWQQGSGDRLEPSWAASEVARRHARIVQALIKLACSGVDDALDGTAVSQVQCVSVCVCSPVTVDWWTSHKHLVPVTSCTDWQTLTLRAAFKMLCCTTRCRPVACMMLAMA